MGGVRAGLLLLGVGVVAGQLPGFDGPWVATALGAAAAGPVLAAARWRRARGPLVLAGLLAIGAALGAARLRQVTAPALPAGHVARFVLPLRTALEGHVVDGPVRQPGRTVMTLETAAVGRGVAATPASGRVHLSIRGEVRKVRWGDWVRVETTLRRPRNFENPGRFDRVGLLARRGVYVAAAVWDAAALQRLPRRSRGLRVAVERWRARLARRIAGAVGGDAGAVLTALVIGDESGLDPGLRDAFTRAGVVHVLSVSGLHVGIVAGAAFTLLRWLGARSRRLLLHADVTRLAAVGSILPVGVYTLLAGLEIATLRSAIMVACAALAVLAGRRVDVLRTLAVAAIVLALGWPGSPQEIGFQLSFASVLAIVLGTRRFAARAGEGRWGRAVAFALVSPCALAGTAPLTALHFHQVSAMGLIANPLVVPLFGAVVLAPGLLGACCEPLCPTAAALLFRGAGWLIQPGLALVRRLAAPSWAAVSVPVPTGVELILLYGMLAAVLLRPRRVAGGLVVLASLGLLVDAGWWLHRRWAPGVLRVTFLDVGQGDAAVVELPDGRVLVVDAGGFPGSGFDTGAGIVAPSLRALRIGSIDALVMTHAHPDHSGGIPALLSDGWAREFWWTGDGSVGPEWERLRAAVAGSGVRERRLRAGDATGLAGVTVLHPPRGWAVTSLNETSLVLRLDYGAVAMLLTGDAEARAEAGLLTAPDRLRAAVLKVPHHGSRTSSGTPFVDAVAPAIAVVSVGEDNRYRLPAPDVEARYRARGACLLRTDRCGAIRVETDGHALRIVTARPGCGCAVSTPPP